MSEQEREPQADGNAPAPKKSRIVGRRRALKVGLAVAGGLALVETYSKPSMISIGVREAYAATPLPPTPTPAPTATRTTGSVEGCTPGFWGNEGNDYAGGKLLWNQPNDPDWATYSPNHGVNPFSWDTLFTSFFASHPDVEGYVMYVSGKDDGLADISNPTKAQQCARHLVAGYLNVSWGMNYPYTTDQLTDMWSQAVATNTDAGFEYLKNLLDTANNAGCPISKRQSAERGVVVRKPKP